jgi:hypothetical protein
MEEELKATGHHPADSNGDGRVSDQERDMYLEFKRKELEDQDLMRDAQRKMAWFSLIGMLFYPSGIFITVLFGLDKAAELIGDIASIYFLSVAAIVSAFFGFQSTGAKKK